VKDELAPVSYTAFRVMFYVALEQYQGHQSRLLHDDLASQMLPRRLRLLVRLLGLKPLRDKYLNLIEQRFPGTRSSCVRKRYIDDKLAEALSNNIDAVVILGSGLDTRAYRIPELSNLTVYEVDLPKTIAYKEGRLRALFGSVPPHVRLVSMDFDRQVLGEVLGSHGYSLQQKTFFIWEGVTQYISQSAVLSTFDFLAAARPGSQIAFTYIVKEFIDGKSTLGQERLYMQTRVEQELWRFGLQPSEIPAFIGRYSWRQLDHIGADEFRQRYLVPRGRTDKLLEIERMVYAEKTSA
jgi:methyltransferase (TIGR00027 family)